MSTFKVVQHGAASSRTVFETDDWLAAEAFAADARRRNQRLGNLDGNNFSVEGVHPSHHFVQAQGETRCTVCGTYDNSSYGSHAPCGFDSGGKSLAWHIERWVEDGGTFEQAGNTEPPRCIFRGPYLPVGDTDWQCTYHRVELVRVAGRYGDQVRRADVACPEAGERGPDGLTDGWRAHIDWLNDCVDRAGSR